MKYPSESKTVTRSPTGFAPEHDLLGRQHVRQPRIGGARNPVHVVTAPAVAGPVRTGRHDHDLGAVVEHAGAVKARRGDRFHVGQPVELDRAVVDEPSPLT